MRQVILGKKLEDMLGIVIMCIPGIVLLSVVIMYPLAKSIFLSFHEMSLIHPELGMPFIGVKNFIKVFQDEIFYIAFKNTLIFSFASVFGQMILGLVLALILDREDVPFKGVLRSLALVPWVVPTVVTAVVWKWMYNPFYGIVNDMLSRLGLIDKYISWLYFKSTAMPSLIVANVWKGTPFMMVMFLAGLKNIPNELYEAARIDGASSMQLFRYITLPQLRGTIVVVTLLSGVWNFQNFTLPWALTQGGPGYQTETLVLYVYRNAFRNYNFGYASSLGTMLLAILMIFAYFYFSKAYKGSEY